MLRMIRSARSRLNRDQGQDENADSTAAVGSTNTAVLSRNGNNSLRLEPGESAEQAGKRIGTKTMLGGAGQGQRISRHRSSTDGMTAPCGMENAGAAPVLSDVTNTGQQLWLTQCPRTCGKPPAGPLRDATGSTCTSTPATPSDVEADLMHADDPQHVVEYCPDIFRNLQHDEMHCHPKPGYMEQQPHVNPKMRSILVDWLVDVHKKYKLRPETLYLAVSMLDRYLEKKTTLRRHLQLVGVTALLAAAKFEELYPPQIQDFIYVTDRAYTKEEVIKMEILLLSTLDFQISRPTAVHFLDRYQCINGCTEAHRDLAHYLLELTLGEYKMVKYPPSHLAAATILLSNKLLRRQPSWSQTAVKHTKMTEQMLKECAKEICGILELTETNQLQAVRKKYSQLKYHSVAKLNFAGACQKSANHAAPDLANSGVGQQASRSARAAPTTGTLQRRSSIGCTTDLTSFNSGGQLRAQNPNHMGSIGAGPIPVEPSRGTMF